IDGHSSVHDAATAASMGLAGAPIEAPTHFSQFDPLAFVAWGPAWFERGCISSHFRTMVVEGEQVQATLIVGNGSGASAGAGAGAGAGGGGRIEAHKADGTAVLAGSVAVGPDYGTSELEARRAAQGDPGDLFIVDRLNVGFS